MPSIEVLNPIADGEMAPSSGIKLSITHPDPSVLIRYRLDDSSELQCNPPRGDEYESRETVLVCGSDEDHVVRAIACRTNRDEEGEGTSVSSSAIALQVISVLPYSPPPPQRPSLTTDPPNACKRDASSRLKCTTEVHQALTLHLSTNDFACSNPVFGEEGTCTGGGYLWGPMQHCSSLSSAERPCVDVYVTLDDSDPSDPSSPTRRLVTETGLSLGAGAHSVRAVSVRFRRQYSKRTCPCCCRGAECLLPGPELTEQFSIQHQTIQEEGGGEREALLGSPDVTLLLETPFETFEQQYYADRFKWRSDMASALGLRDYRRVQGQCDCVEASGCLGVSPDHPTRSHDVCFHPASGGLETTVVLYIKAVGSCDGDDCHDNDPCGDTVCEVDPRSWLPAYARLQREEAATIRALSKLSVLQVRIQTQVDTSSLKTKASGTAGAVAGIVVAVVLVVVAASLSLLWRRRSLHKRLLQGISMEETRLDEGEDFTREDEK